MPNNDQLLIINLNDNNITGAAYEDLTHPDSFDDEDFFDDVDDESVKLDAMSDSTLLAMYRAFTAEVARRDGLVAAGSTTPIGNALTADHASPISQGLTFEYGEGGPNPDNHYVAGPIYTAKELRIIATHALVGLASAASVADNVRMEAAMRLAANSVDLATESKVK